MSDQPRMDASNPDLLSDAADCSTAGQVSIQTYWVAEVLDGNHWVAYSGITPFITEKSAAHYVQYIARKFRDRKYRMSRFVRAAD